MGEGGFAGKWRKLSGEDNWNSLLEPLDIDLRRYLIFYGERVQANYDTFILDRRSRYAGASKFTKKQFFSRLGLDKGNPIKYNVVKYIYATSTSPTAPQSFLLKSLVKDPYLGQSNWMGYIAVSSEKSKPLLGRRDIVISWRGTIQISEWIENFDFPLKPTTKVFPTSTCALAHSGFLSIYTSSHPNSRFNKTSARDQVVSTIKRLVERYKDEDVSITVIGHSLGGALATLTGGDIAVNGYNKPTSRPNKSFPVTVFAYGNPILGNICLRELLDKQENLHILRTVNMIDFIQFLPPLIGYEHIGHKLVIDTRKSPYLKAIESYAKRHNMEASYLHGLAGSHGVDKEFKLVITRDLALVNKRTNLLKDEYLIPNHWWTQQNKGMVQLSNGSWKLHELKGYPPQNDEIEYDDKDDDDDDDEDEIEHDDNDDDEEDEIEHDDKDDDDEDEINDDDEEDEIEHDDKDDGEDEDDKDRDEARVQISL